MNLSSKLYLLVPIKKISILIMKIYYLSIVLLFVIILYSCDDTVEIEYFKVKIDSLTVQDTIQVTDTLKIRLLGVIGNNGCYSFHKYETNLYNNTMNLTIWGKLEKHDICTFEMVGLDDIFRVFPISQGKFYININQPDGSLLRDSVYIIP